MRAQLTLDKLFQAGLQSPELDAVLLSCASRGESLRVELTDEGATFTTSADAEATQAIGIRGRWRSELLRGSYDHAGSLLLAPFLFAFRELSFPAQSLYTMGGSARSVADMCMRNLFFAALRREPIRFLAGPVGKSGARASRDLVRMYRWIAKSYLPDEVLARGDAAELLLANSFTDLGLLTSPLLASGMWKYRDTAALMHRGGDCKVAFMLARQRAMALYET